MRLVNLDSIHDVRLHNEKIPDSALIVQGTHTIEGGIAAFGKLLAGPTPPTAVLCSNDMTAMGVMRKAYEERIRIPTDLSVIGFDDIRLAQFVLPALTTVQMSQADLARLASGKLPRPPERSTSSKHTWCFASRHACFPPTRTP